MYCIYAKSSDSDENVICKKRGEVSKTYSCKKFKYNLLARNPKRLTLNTHKYKKEDFEF